jgi:glutamyl-tRNA synthetase
MSSLSDPVLLRADGRVIYTLASVVDDIDHGITTILRGEDHVTNSAAQIQLFEALGASAPEMGHMALLAGADGQGLSKRLGSLSIGQLREEGFEPLAITALLSRIGTSDPIEAFGQLNDIIEQFSLEKFGRSTAKFDPDELRIINSKTLQLLEFDEVSDRFEQFGLSKIDAEFWNAIRGNISYFQDINFWWQLCHSELTPVMEDAEICKIAVETLPQGELTAEIWPSWVTAISDKSSKKGRALFRPLRLALTGRTEGPEVKNLLKYMGRERVQKRLSGITA